MKEVVNEMNENSKLSKTIRFCMQKNGAGLFINDIEVRHIPSAQEIVETSTAQDIWREQREQKRLMGGFG